MFTDIKSKMNHPTVHKIIAYAAFDGSPEGVAKEVKSDLSNPE